MLDLWPNMYCSDFDFPGKVDMNLFKNAFDRIVHPNANRHILKDFEKGLKL